MTHKKKNLDTNTLNYQVLLIKNSIFLFLVFFIGCSNVSLKKNVSKVSPVRLGIIGFKITAPIKKLKDIQTIEKDKTYPILEEEIRQREIEAKEFFIQYMRTYYKEVEVIDIPIEKVNWKKKLNFSHNDLHRIRDEFQVDAVIAGEIPWYGKTNLVWPIIGFTADITIETLIIGLVTDWNGPLIVANLGWEVLTNGPLWFGGAWLFGQAYKPVTVNVKMISLQREISEYEKEIEVTKSAHMLSKVPKNERKKIEIQLDASLKKAIKEVAIELNAD